MIAERVNIASVIAPLWGWCTVSKAERLFNLVIESDSKLTVELGVFGARSLTPLALAHKEKGSGVCIGIDAWKAEVATEGTNSPANDEYWRNVDYKSVYNSCVRAIQSNQLDEICYLLKLKSQTVGKILFADNSIDILHQDSGHNVETISEELELFIPKLKLGGYWVADDVQWVEAKDGYAKLPEYGLELFEDYVEWAIWKKIK